MDIKLKKSSMKRIAIAILLIVVNLAPFVYAIGTGALTVPDYQDNKEFTNITMDLYVKLLDGPEFWNEKWYLDTNMIYQVDTGKKNVTNSEVIKLNDDGMPTVPEGYNYIVYYDGTRLHMYKNGTELVIQNPDNWRSGGKVLVMAYAEKPTEMPFTSSVYDLYKKVMQPFYEGLKKLAGLIVLAVVLDIVFRTRIGIFFSRIWRFMKSKSYRSKLEAQMDVLLREKMASERMKVELVTNVSHDLKTPLTSMISYIQLLKDEEMSEDAKLYVDILDKKSEHLKKMVLDVFDLSKAATGQLDVDIKEIDYSKLMAQTLADMSKEIENSDVFFAIDITDEPVIILTDGERMYRVFQNLIENTLKYSLKGSRVYIALKKSSDSATVTIKNVSENKLNSKVDYTERFVRGDSNRSDGGSGLGLAIAKSFTECCNGKFNISADADLFTASVTFENV